MRTTGVYCRPTCPSRLAKRDNVRFHSTRADAERADFGLASAAGRMNLRSRCVNAQCRHPRLPPHRDCERGPDSSKTGRIREHEPVPLSQDVQDADGSNSEGLCRRKPNTTSTDRTRQWKERDRGDLRRGVQFQRAVLRVRRPATRNDTHRLPQRRCENQYPLCRGEEFTRVDPRRRDGEGICAIFLDDDPDTLAHELHTRFPKARIRNADASFSKWVARVVRLVENPAAGFDLPLDVRGTAFQLRVWDALRESRPARPAATPRSPAGSAAPPRRGGRGACAANPVAIVIPCHRVVRTDESLSGYRWGVERKAELLEARALDMKQHSRDTLCKAVISRASLGRRLAGLDR